MDKILEIINYLYREKKIDICMLYGSRDPQTDTDLLIVLDDDIEESPRFYEKMDITEISTKDFYRKLNNLDIVYTEPILNGEILLGDTNKIKEIIKDLTKKKITDEALEYLKKQAITSYLDSQYFRDIHAYNYAYEQIRNNPDTSAISTILDWNQFQAKVKSNEIWFSIINLAYSASYTSLIRHYSKHNYVATLQELLKNEENTTLLDIVNYKRQISRKQQSINLSQIDQYKSLVRVEIKNILST